MHREVQRGRARVERHRVRAADRRANSFSNRCTRGPVVSHPDRRTATHLVDLGLAEYPVDKREPCAAPLHSSRTGYLCVCGAPTLRATWLRQEAEHALVLREHDFRGIA